MFHKLSIAGIFIYESKILHDEKTGRLYLLHCSVLIVSASCVSVVILILPRTATAVNIFIPKYRATYNRQKKLKLEETVHALQLAYWHIEFAIHNDVCLSVLVPGTGLSVLNLDPLCCGYGPRTPATFNREKIFDAERGETSFLSSLAFFSSLSHQREKRHEEDKKEVQAKEKQHLNLRADSKYLNRNEGKTNKHGREILRRGYKRGTNSS